MSSDSISLIQNPDTARMQGAQRATGSQSSADPSNLYGQRQASAAGGKELPLKTTQPTQDTPVTQQQVASAVSQISDFVQNFQRDLLFSIDEESERLVVKVVDSETQEVIRQIPSEESLRIAKNLDAADSLMLRERA